MAKLSETLFVVFFDKEQGMSRREKAFIFKFGDDYQRHHNHLLYFCNWAGEQISLKDGWRMYHSLGC